MPFDFPKRFQELLTELGSEAEDAISELEEKLAVTQENLNQAFDDYSKLKIKLEEKTDKLVTVERIISVEKKATSAVETELAKVKGELARSESQLKKRDKDLQQLEKKYAELEEKLVTREAFHEDRYQKLSAKRGEAILEIQKLKGEV